MVKTPEQKKTKLSNRDAKTFWPDTYKEDRVDNQILSEFLGQVETQHIRPRGETPAGLEQPSLDRQLWQAMWPGSPFDWNWNEVSGALGPPLHKVCKASRGHSRTRQ